jgi:hypothetical protein
LGEKAATTPSTRSVTSAGRMNFMLRFMCHPWLGGPRSTSTVPAIMSARLVTNVTLFDASCLLKIDYNQVMPEITAQEVAVQLGAKLDTLR